MNATDVCQKAELLLEEGRFDDAIAVLTDYNRQHYDDDVGAKLTEVRHRAWPYIQHEQPSPRVAPGTPPAIGPSGLPEISADEIDPSTVQAALKDKGSLIVRDVLEPEQIELVKSLIDSAVDNSDVEWTNASPPYYQPMPWSDDVIEALGKQPDHLRRGFIHKAGGVLLVDSPRAMFDLLEVFEELGLHDVVSGHLGCRPTISANKCTLRRVHLQAIGGWHQDGAFLGDHISAINLWFALTDCGVDAPGLELVGESLDDILETGGEGAYFDWDVAEQRVNATFTPDQLIRPELNAGDLVIFDEMNLHRTHITPEMTKERHAIEFWCFSAARYPGGHTPLVW